MLFRALPPISNETGIAVGVYCGKSLSRAENPLWNYHLYHTIGVRLKHSRATAFCENSRSGLPALKASFPDWETLPTGGAGMCGVRLLTLVSSRDVCYPFPLALTCYPHLEIPPSHPGSVVAVTLPRK